MKKVILLLIASFPISLFGQSVNLALNRPVTVSSTAHAPTQAEFAVDGEPRTGWRARFNVEYDNDNTPVRTLPQWVMVDLQGTCTLEEVRLFCEADADTPEYVKDRRFTLGHEIYSSYPTKFRIEVSNTGASWTVLRSIKNAKGGAQSYNVQTAGKKWRYVRIFIEECSSNLPVAINELEVIGNCDAQRMPTWGWKERRKEKTSPDLSLLSLSDNLLLLPAGWEMACDGWLENQREADISSAAYNTDNWYNATVPGTVVATLVEQEVFPDPAVGLNNLRIPEVLNKNRWWYRRSFHLPRGWKKNGDRVFLELDKINHHADIWVNGSKVGNIDYCFVQENFDITEYLEAGKENVIAILIHPMDLTGVPGDKGAEGNAWVNSRVISRSSPTYICSSGWDWMPAMRDRAMGILEEVRLHRTGGLKIEDVHVQTDLHLPDTTKAFVSIAVEIRNTSEKQQEGEINLSFGGIDIKAPVKVAPGALETVKFLPGEYAAMEMKNPRLWWPNGYGEQNLYDLGVCVKTGKTNSDALHKKFGIRKVTYNAPLVKERRGTHYIGQTKARYIRICMQESNTDSFGMFDLSVFNTEGDPDEDLAAWKKATVSSVKGEKYPAAHLTDVRGVSKWFSASDRDEWAIVDLGEITAFDKVVTGWDSDGLASKYLIQISDDANKWHTVKEATETQDNHLVITVNGIPVFCKGGNWGLYEVALRMPRERMETALRFHHDSGMNMIRGWMGTSLDRDFFECCDKYGIMVFSDLWGGMPEDKARYTEIARDNIKRFRSHPSIVLWCASNETYPAVSIDKGIRDAVMELDSLKLYQSHSADDILWGGEGPYFWVPTTEYYKMAHGFKSEIGLPTVPVYETMLRLTGDDQAWPIGDTWYYHDYSSKSEQAIGRYINAFESMLGKVTSMEDYCRKAQFVNYDNIRAMFEAWNSKLWEDCSGVLLWMTHPAWYSTVWQTYDYDFEVNGTWAGAKKGCEPRHIQLSQDHWQVDVINNTSQPMNGFTATSRIYDIYGKQYGEPRSSKINVASSSKKRMWQVEFSDELPPLHFVKLELRDEGGKLVSDNFYWRYSNPQDMAALNTSGDATLTGRVVKTYEKHDRTYVELELENRGDVVAVMTRLSLRDSEGERILPTLYSDNYFGIVPGEVKNLTIDYPTAQIPMKQVLVSVSAYNSKENYIRLQN